MGNFIRTIIGAFIAFAQTYREIVLGMVFFIVSVAEATVNFLLKANPLGMIWTACKRLRGSVLHFFTGVYLLFEHGLPQKKDYE